MLVLVNDTSEAPIVLMPYLRYSVMKGVLFLSRCNKTRVTDQVTCAREQDKAMSEPPCVALLLVSVRAGRVHMNKCDLGKWWNCLCHLGLPKLGSRSAGSAVSLAASPLFPFPPNKKYTRGKQGSSRLTFNCLVKIESDQSDRTARSNQLEPGMSINGKKC